MSKSNMKEIMNEAKKLFGENKLPEIEADKEGTIKEMRTIKI